MTPTISTLANGLRVVTQPMPNLETVSLGLWVGAGARHESEREHGISHFLEHMAFKGTKQRSAQEIAEEIEQVGGELNAATSLETTGLLRPRAEGRRGCRARPHRGHSAEGSVRPSGARGRARR